MKLLLLKLIKLIEKRINWSEYSGYDWEGRSSLAVGSSQSQALFNLLFFVLCCSCCCSMVLAFFTLFFSWIISCLSLGFLSIERNFIDVSKLILVFLFYDWPTLLKTCFSINFAILSIWSCWQKKILCHESVKWHVG